MHIDKSLEIAKQPFPSRRSLLRRSELLSAPVGSRFEEYPWGCVDRYDDYPGYYDGNRLFINKAPSSSEIADWLSLYRTLFPERVTKYPAVIVWCDELESASEVSGAEEFIAFTWSQGDECQTNAPRTSGSLLEIVSPEDWNSLERLESQVNPHLTAFNRWRIRSFQRLIEERGGTYQALFNGSALVSAAGAVRDDDIARFLSVATDAQFRSKGFASQLIRSVRGAAGSGGRLVTIVAESKSPAERLYRSLGFVPFVKIRTITIDET